MDGVGVGGGNVHKGERPEVMLLHVCLTTRLICWDALWRKGLDLWAPRLRFPSEMLLMTLRGLFSEPEVKCQVKIHVKKKRRYSNSKYNVWFSLKIKSVCAYHDGLIRKWRCSCLMFTDEALHSERPLNCRGVFLYTLWRGELLSTGSIFSDAAKSN